MVVNWISFLFLVLMFIQSPTLFAAEKRNKVEEFFIWKMSDELKLTASEEQQFTALLKDLNKKKQTLNQDLQAAVEQMSAELPDKKKEQHLKKYRDLLKSYNHLSETEYDKLKPLLGPTRMVQYLKEKQNLTNRIKALLSQPEGQTNPIPKKPLPPPKLIEEK